MSNHPPVEPLTELPSYRGYYIDATQRLFTHWRLLMAANATSGRRYIHRVAKRADLVAVQPERRKVRGKVALYCLVLKKRRLKFVPWVDLLTEAVRGPRPVYLATHLDGDRHNTSPENLDWCSAADHRAIMSAGAPVRKKGKLGRKDVERIVRRLGRGEKAANLAREYGVSRAAISQIKLGQRRFSRRIS